LGPYYLGLEEFKFRSVKRTLPEGNSLSRRVHGRLKVNHREALLGKECRSMSRKEKLDGYKGRDTCLTVYQLISEKEEKIHSLSVLRYSRRSLSRSDAQLESGGKNSLLRVKSDQRGNGEGRGVDRKLWQQRFVNKRFRKTLCAAEKNLKHFIGSEGEPEWNPGPDIASANKNRS